MIVFENPQEIDICAISTFGVSVKEGDNPIGFFGTGLKYAIAVLLRTGHEITIYSGLTAVNFGIRRGAVRGQEFEFITMAVDQGNPIDIGFTTQLGKQWALWMAYREIACNCKDEGGVITETNRAPNPESGKTVIIVKGAEFESIYSKRHDFIIEDEPSMVIGTMELRRRPTQHFFYRGVQVHQLGKPAMLTYNDLESLELTEDRTVRYQYMPQYRVACAYLCCEDERLLRKILTAEDNTFEGGLDYHGHHVKAGETFLRTVGELCSDRLTKVNITAVQVWKDATQKLIAPRTIVLTPVQRMMLERALDFCSKIGFAVRDSYPISIVESLGPGTLGLAADDTIFIAQRTFEMGTKYVASTLIEEFVHLRHSYRDCTRDMQNFLFDKLMSMGEELQGEPL